MEKAHCIQKSRRKTGFLSYFFLKTICHVFRFVVSYAPLMALDVTAVVEMIVAVDAFVALVAHHQNVVQVLDVLPVVHLKHSYPDQNLVPVVDALALAANHQNVVQIDAPVVLNAVELTAVVAQHVVDAGM